MSKKKLKHNSQKREQCKIKFLVHVIRNQERIACVQALLAGLG